MRIYVISIHPAKRGSTCPPPEVHQNFDVAVRRYQDYCGSNASVNAEGETVHTHWKSKTVSRFDIIDVPIVNRMPVTTRED